MPNEKWLTDVTEFKYYIGSEKHKVYLSAILDLYDRRIVSFVIRDRNDILSSYKVEQQGYKSCMGLLKLADKYTPERLENACKRALEYTPRPSLKNI